MKKIRAAISGATGYTGQELLRLLLGHPAVEVTAVSSQSMAGQRIADRFPYFRGRIDLSFEKLDPKVLGKKADVVFLALPHGAAILIAGELVGAGVKVIDLSADFRLKNKQDYSAWYGWDHPDGAMLKEAVYGLPESHRAQIKKARLIANPGCYPTSVLLGTLPLLNAGLVHAEGIVADSKSGASGAGRAPKPDLQFSEVNESFKAYKVAAHQHTPEIEQELGGVAGKPVRVVFTAHLLPITRGILSTIYLRPAGKARTKDIVAALNKAYAKEPFVRVYPEGSLPEVKAVRGQNYCDIGVAVDDRTRTVIVVTAIDNLIKGAAGQAVQNMNILFGLPETQGLL